jgi:hypothetical protein
MFLNVLLVKLVRLVKCLDFKLLLEIVALVTIALVELSILDPIALILKKM